MRNIATSVGWYQVEVIRSNQATPRDQPTSIYFVSEQHQIVNCCASCSVLYKPLVCMGIYDCKLGFCTKLKVVIVYRW